MPTQKTFKSRVRARMTKTGEAYTTARQQLLRKAESRAAAVAPEVPIAPESPATPEAADPEPTVEFPTSEEAVVGATGRTYPAWFALLDRWGATARRHSEIAAWLAEEHGVAPWWRQSVTVAYERARGMRAVHQMTDGFSVAVTRTVAADPDAALLAFTDPAIRRSWLGDVPLEQRRTTAARVARFDWPEPPSRLVVQVLPKADGRSTIAIAHERLPDGNAAAHEKAAWRDRLAALKAILEPDRRR
jgi:hypothetical protein